MIQRLPADEPRVVRLGTLFAPAEVMASPVIGIDPEQERLKWLQEAREAGHAEGMRQADAQIRDAVAAAELACHHRHAQALAELQDQRPRLAQWSLRLPAPLAGLERAMLAMAIQLAYAAMLRVLDALPAEERIAQACRQALAEQKQRPLLLRLPPLDAPFAQALATAEIRIEADARLQPGQCRIESPLGIDDAGLDVRLDALRTAFLQGLASAGDAQ